MEENGRNLKVLPLPYQHVRGTRVSSHHHICLGNVTHVVTDSTIRT